VGASISRKAGAAPAWPSSPGRSAPRKKDAELAATLERMGRRRGVHALYISGRPSPTGSPVGHGGWPAFEGEELRPRHPQPPRRPAPKTAPGGLEDLDERRSCDTLGPQELAGFLHVLAGRRSGRLCGVLVTFGSIIARIGACRARPTTAVAQTRAGRGDRENGGPGDLPALARCWPSNGGVGGLAPAWAFFVPHEWGP